MTEKEQAHRHQCEKDVIVAERQYGSRGQYLGAGLIILPLIAAFYCATHGLTVAAGIFLAPPIIAGAVAFIGGQLKLFSQQDEK